MIYFIAQWMSLQLETKQSERGASAVEYGLLVAGVAAVIVTAVFLFGGALNTLMGDSCGTIMAKVKGTAC